jgi:hypothetical protein
MIKNDAILSSLIDLIASPNVKKQQKDKELGYAPKFVTLWR